MAITLSATLLASQKSSSYDALQKIALTYGATTNTYLKDRIISISHSESADSHVATVLLDNADGEFTGLDLKAYKGIISYGIHTDVTRPAWQANHVYAIGDVAHAFANGDVVIPTTPNGYQYICTVAGTSHATTEPIWPTEIGETVTDGGVTWETNGYAGDEYIPHAPLYVVAHQLNSLEGRLICYLTLAGIPNLLAGDKASAAYVATSTNTDTIKTIINQVLHDLTGAGAVFDHCLAYTVVWDNEDGLVDSYYPADSFTIAKDEDRRTVVKRLLGWTKCVLLFRADGHVHIDCPTYADAVDYEYSLADTYHQFFSKAYRKRLVLPGRFEVTSRTGDDPQYSGSAEDTDIAALSADEKKRLQATIHPHTFLTGDDYAGWVADAMLLQQQRDADSGSGNVPMNYGAEVWDYVKVTDAREDDYRLGHQQRLSFSSGGGKMPRLSFSFGRGITGVAGTSIAGLTDLTLSGIQSELEGIQNEIVQIVELLSHLAGLGEGSSLVKVKASSYAGDSTSNRAITHNLGVKPVLVLIWEDASPYYWYAIYDNVSTSIYYMSAAANGKLTETTPDTSVFYVGNAGSYAHSANISGAGFHWLAIAGLNLSPT